MKGSRRISERRVMWFRTAGEDRKCHGSRWKPKSLLMRGVVWEGKTVNDPHAILNCIADFQYSDSIISGHKI